MIGCALHVTNTPRMLLSTKSRTTSAGYPQRCSVDPSGSTTPAEARGTTGAVGRGDAIGVLLLASIEVGEKRKVGRDAAAWADTGVEVLRGGGA